jgi:hypothetical protein
MADPLALSVAAAARDAVHFIGIPEANTGLPQSAIYLATAPLHLRHPPAKLMTDLGYGKGYRHTHDEAEHMSDMDCLPPARMGRWFYEPTAWLESIVTEPLTSLRAQTSLCETSGREAENEREVQIPGIRPTGMPTSRMHGYAALWFSTSFIAASLVLSIATIVAHRRVPAPRSRPLPRYPKPETRPSPTLVLGETHHHTTSGPAPQPTWLTIPQRGLYTGVMILGPCRPATS